MSNKDRSRNQQSSEDDEEFVKFIDYKRRRRERYKLMKARKGFKKVSISIGKCTGVIKNSNNHGKRNILNGYQENEIQLQPNCLTREVLDDNNLSTIEDLSSNINDKTLQFISPMQSLGNLRESHCNKRLSDKKLQVNQQKAFTSTNDEKPILDSMLLDKIIKLEKPVEPYINNLSDDEVIYVGKFTNSIILDDDDEEIKNATPIGDVFLNELK